MSTVLVDAQKLIESELANLNKTIAKPDSTKISVKGKVFTLPNGKSHAGPLTVIIVDWRNQRKYYPHYDPKKLEAPYCFASNKIVKDLKPSINADKPQSKTCAECKLDQFGSSTKGKGKECKNSVKIAIIQSDFDEESDVLHIDVAPKSLKSFNKFVTQLGDLGMIPLQVTVDIAFDHNEEYPKLIFSKPQPHDKLITVMGFMEQATEILDKEFIKN